MVQVATMGAQGEGPKGQNFANFKLLLQIQLKWNSKVIHVVRIDLLR